MHQWGVGGFIEKVAPTGSTTLLHSTTNYSFANQKNYYLDTPLVVSPGTKINFACKWNNGASNQPFMDGVQMTPVDLYWGESSYDEMCMNVLSFTEKLKK